MLVSCSAYSSTLKIEAICSSETSVDFERTTLRYIPEDSALRNVISQENVEVIILLINFDLSIAEKDQVYSRDRWVERFSSAQTGTLKIR
jgi:hypothetical protein